MAALIKYYKDQIESAIQDAVSNGYLVLVNTDCCGCGGPLEIWDQDGESSHVIDWVE